MLDIVGFAALIKRKRGEARLTQETLALDVFGDPARKADISRLENAKTPKPQEATIQKICKALNISNAEMEPLRQSRPSAAQLDNIPSLSREALQNLAARFNIEESFTIPDEALRKQLTLRADEFRALKAEVDAIPETMIQLSNLKAAAQEAIDRVDLEEVENLMALVHETELEEAAKSAEIRANTALLRGKVEDAYRYLAAAADSFAAVDPLEPARKRILRYFVILRNHGLRYGGSSLSASEKFIGEVVNEALRENDSWLWGAGKNWLAVALQDQGIRTEGAEGAGLLAQAVTAYRSALEVRTRTNHPLEWAKTQNNLASALQYQDIRTKGAEGADLLAQAVTAYRSALEVYTCADHSVNWATIQNNLAVALQDQGKRTEGVEGANLLAEAVTTYRNALEVRTRAAHPVDWAANQNNLGNALKNQGIRTERAEGADLLAQAVTAYCSALEVTTRTDHPVYWAMTQENIANCEETRAAHDSCPYPRPPLTAALEAAQNALTVYDPEHMSYYHANATRIRDRIQAKLDALPPA